MDDAQRNTLTALGVLLMAGALTWVLMGLGSQTSAERLAPAVVVVVVGGLLIWLAWRRPHQKKGHAMTPTGRQSGGGDQYIANIETVQAGGIGQQVNVNRAPEPKLNVQKTETDVGDGPYASKWRLDIDPPSTQLPFLVVFAKAPTATNASLRTAGGIATGLLEGCSSADDPEISFAQVTQPVFPVVFSVDTANPGEDIKLEFSANPAISL